MSLDKTYFYTCIILLVMFTNNIFVLFVWMNKFRTTLIQGLLFVFLSWKQCCHCYLVFCYLPLANRMQITKDFSTFLKSPGFFSWIVNYGRLPICLVSYTKQVEILIIGLSNLWESTIDFEIWEAEKVAFLYVHVASL